MAVVKVGCREILATGEPISMIVFPNPNDGHFKVECTTTCDAPSTIQVMDVVGQVIFADVMHGQFEHDINLSDKPAGIYFVRFQSNEKTIVKKIEITH